MYLLRRIAPLALLFALELVVLSIWLDTAALSSRIGLAAWIGDWGPSAIRLLVVFAISWLAFAARQSHALLTELSEEMATTPVSRWLLGAHAAAIVVFSLASRRVFAEVAPTSGADWLLATWLTSGIAAVPLGAAALLPPRLWEKILHATGNAKWFATATAVLVMGASSLGGSLWKPTTAATFVLVRQLLQPFVAGLIWDAKTMMIGTNNFAVIINPQCSGLEGVALVLAFGLGWIALFRREYRFPQALLLIPVSMGLSWILNAFRIAALILIGNAGAASIAIGGFHSQAGWIGFSVVAVAFSMAGERVAWVRRKHVAERVEGSRPAAPYLLPFLSILVAGILCRIVATNSFEWLYPLRFLVALAVLWHFRAEYRRLDWRSGWMSWTAGVAVFVFWIALEPLNRGAASGVAAGLNGLTAAGRTTWLIVRALAAITTVPIAEELAFRGFLIRRFESSKFLLLDPTRFTALGLAGSSVAFGLLHGDRWVAGTMAGLVYAALYLRKGRIGDAVVAHASTNAALAAWVLIRGDWGLW